MARRTRDMRVQLAPELIKKLKKQDVRLRKSFRLAIDLFSTNPNAPKLDNHELQQEWAGFKSIDITNEWRALYTEKKEGDEIAAYFEEIGTHEELYGRDK